MSAEPKILYKTSAVAVGGRDGQVKTNDGKLVLNLSIPKQLGGPGKEDSTNPEQLFAAGYAACFESAIRHVARSKKISIAELQVEASVGLIPAEKGFALVVELHPQFTGFEQPLCEDLVKLAHEVCPYSNAVRNNVAVSIKTN